MQATASGFFCRMSDRPTVGQCHQRPRRAVLSVRWRHAAPLWHGAHSRLVVCSRCMHRWRRTMVSCRTVCSSIQTNRKSWRSERLCSCVLRHLPCPPCQSPASIYRQLTRWKYQSWSRAWSTFGLQQPRDSSGTIMHKPSDTHGTANVCADDGARTDVSLQSDPVKNWLLQRCAPWCSNQKLQRVQNSAARIVLQAPRRSHTKSLLRQLHWLPVQQRITYKVAVLRFKVCTTSMPTPEPPHHNARQYMDSTLDNEYTSVLV